MINPRSIWSWRQDYVVIFNLLRGRSTPVGGAESLAIQLGKHMLRFGWILVPLGEEHVFQRCWAEAPLVWSLPYQ